ncbi:P63C domain-containing protein [Paraburkholderia eburnea]|uniref:P63C domain-containing protein n=1 Tax=Paraburkholderia eburnea TaxID=1189126 RepID=A0A2S4LY72_9BURK|nr:P63C domain-containing protein [Paraburkholderia eburnea]POR47305.1 P63C domain-containing protein [Paraburkholderia eburnea]PRZ18682.1 P63C domain-containing protein [Paraburkholderia eburnea]
MEAKGKAVGAAARAASLSPERRKEIATRAAAAKKELASLPKVTHGSTDHPLTIGDAQIPCYVLENGIRVLSQRGLQAGIGMSTGGGTGGEQRLAAFALSLAEKFKENNTLSARSVALAERLKDPIKFNLGGKIAYGYEATVLADLCDVVLGARAEGLLMKQQEHIGAQAELLVRGFARVGIIALVDEATGYQKDRERDALAKILEAFVAKELQPYVKTFPPDYYEHLFRLYKLPFPPEGNKSWRPSFIGKITNEVVYSRLAPELLPELKRLASRAERKAHLHRWLTQDIGHPKLREHLSSIVSILKLSKTSKDFFANVDIVHPRYGSTLPLNFEDAEKEDN